MPMEIRQNQTVQIIRREPVQVKGKIVENLEK